MIEACERHFEIERFGMPFNKPILLEKSNIGYKFHWRKEEKNE
ncbi:hypothetical protein HMP0721_1228 [Pseudoramibacter alactolyticus ATCC 23263]|uniref:Uncharacterized protein n=1 Tax=Pseudoramibacter alactolyticus ATCC 23263 TaxID=887929 RepID=E6MGU5_9FIRM|nr:hypothetical protein HMP0721_1228 [Pseudoramibacter alactolyticus ATCC 23263]